MPGLRNTLKEYAAGRLHSGSSEGPVVDSTKQAVAIALDEGRKAGENVLPPKKKKGKFKHHHAKAMDAFDKGDTTAAMHHVGHMLTALRTGRGNEEVANPMPDPDAKQEATEPSPMSLRSRLGATKQAY